MKALVPGTLFSRLILVLVVGLLAALLLAGMVLYQERLRTLHHASGLQSAQRISELVQLLAVVVIGKLRPADAHDGHIFGQHARVP